ncbi:MAG: hypothetical protein HEQ27_04600 [Dolichospermum sp. JUN01]|nr:hypothetical protein [Dolichospermum sp. JUN01]
MILRFISQFFSPPLQTRIGGLIKISGCDRLYRRGNVIFIHGLGGNALSTWHPEEQCDNVFWFKELEKERPDLSIWSFAYKAPPFKSNDAAMPLQLLANNLLKELKNNDIDKLPIIFITHSMGGLLVKAMLRLAKDASNPINDAIIQKSKGVVFLSTPHNGSSLAYIVDGIGSGLTNVNVKELRPDNIELNSLNTWYRENVELMAIETEVYFETKPTRSGVAQILVVDINSSNPGIRGVIPTAVDADHISIAKPQDINNIVYRGVSRFIEKLIPKKNFFYIERPPNEGKCYTTILQPGALIRIKAPLKMGKTYLTSRIFDYAKQQGYRTVSINLWSKANLKNIDIFLKRFCAILSEALELEVQINRYWSGDFSSQDNCSNYIRRYILPTITTPLVLGLDNIDEIFPYPEITQEFSSLLRSWHERARKEDIWKNLRLIIAHSQRVYVSLDVNKSPFNVGLPIEIGEFDTSQTQELVQRYRLDWSDREIKKLMLFINGHPYLLRTALDEITQSNLSLEDFLNIAPTDKSPYKSFLLNILKTLKRDDLSKAMQTVISTDAPIKIDKEIDKEEAFQLRSLGLIQIQEDETVRCLCDLYRLYFIRHLL